MLNNKNYVFEIYKIDKSTVLWLALITTGQYEKGFYFLMYREKQASHRREKEKSKYRYKKFI